MHHAGTQMHFGLKLLPASVWRCTDMALLDISGSRRVWVGSMIGLLSVCYCFRLWLYILYKLNKAKKGKHLVIPDFQGHNLTKRGSTR